MRFPSKETVERIRKEYPVGTRVELVQMDDPQAPPVGTKGTVRGVDDIGSIMVAWDRKSVCFFISFVVFPLIRPIYIAFSFTVFLAYKFFSPAKTT